jgi:hypothetical protein
MTWLGLKQLECSRAVNWQGVADVLFCRINFVSRSFAETELGGAHLQLECGIQFRRSESNSNRRDWTSFVRRLGASEEDERRIFSHYNSQTDHAAIRRVFIMKATLEFNLPKEKGAFEAARTALIWKETLQDTIVGVSKIWARNDRPANQPAEAVLKELESFLRRLEMRMDENRLNDQF